MDTGDISMGIKRPGRETDHSSPYSAEFKNMYKYISTPHVYIGWCLVKQKICHLVWYFVIQRDKFTRALPLQTTKKEEGHSQGQLCKASTFSLK
jgi:hypothetical protein